MLEVRDPSDILGVPRRAFPPLPPVHVAEATETTRKHWAASSSIATDDALLRDVFDKARFGLPGMVAENGVMDAGMFEYGGQWVRDTSNTLLGLVHAGQFELARRGFEHVLKDMIRDDGGADGRRPL